MSFVESFTELVGDSFYLSIELACFHRLINQRQSGAAGDTQAGPFML
jgi:hypothetical protein